ncbi:MAG: cellulose binding domain-containing protein, partial [Waterburya sp.]
MANNTTSKSLFNTNAQIVEDWNGGYKLEFDLTANSAANNWKLDFSLPYKITAAYGVDLVDNGNGNYSIDGQTDQVNLNAGQTIKPIFIINDGGKQGILPKFSNTGSGTTSPNPVTPAKPTTSLMASPSVVED